MDQTRNRRTGRALALPQVAALAAVSLAAALGLSSCTNVAGFSQPSLVRVIDASYIAPAVNIYVENTLFAGNIGEGYISNYGTVSPSGAAVVKVTQATGGASLVFTYAIPTPGKIWAAPFVTGTTPTGQVDFATAGGSSASICDTGTGSFIQLGFDALAGGLDSHQHDLLVVEEGGKDADGV